MPEKSPHTSIKARVEHCTSQGKLEVVLAGSPYHSKVNSEKGNWLHPIEDRRDTNGNGLAGMLHGISFDEYLQLLDWSSRLLRPGKINLSANAPDILSRLQIDSGSGQATLEKMLSSTKKIGSYFGETTRLNEVAAQRGPKYLKNVAGRATPLTGLSAG